MYMEDAMKYWNCNQIRDDILLGKNLKGIIKFINKEIDNSLKKRLKELIRLTLVIF